MGKALPYFIAGFFNYGLLLWFAARFVHVKIWGSLPLILLLGLLYDVIITSFGFFLSTQAPNSLQVTRYLMLLSVPLFLISGYTWPGTHIPAALNALAWMLPHFSVSHYSLRRTRPATGRPAVFENSRTPR